MEPISISITRRPSAASAPAPARFRSRSSRHAADSLAQIERRSTCTQHAARRISSMLMQHCTRAVLRDTRRLRSMGHPHPTARCTRHSERKIMDSLPLVPPPAALAIVWFYVFTNSARLVTYIPQILAVWRCRDGAHAISLITWSSWVVSHAAAIAYGALVVQDGYFVFISSINFVCSLVITCIAAQRRGVLTAPGRHLARLPAGAQVGEEPALSAKPPFRHQPSSVWPCDRLPRKASADPVR